MLICPLCSKNNFKEKNEKLTCVNCNNVYFKKNKFIDFIISKDTLNIEKKAIKIWGDDLHKKLFSTPEHFLQIKKEFKEDWKNYFKGNVIEIGCGSGSDVKFFSTLDTITKITAIDMGLNTYNLAKFFKDKNNINIYRGNATNLPFKSIYFDVLYSFGVFHHTKNPKRCIEEAFRVLKKNGCMFLYLYSMHENNLIKYLGIKTEVIIKLIIKYLPYRLQNYICVILSPIFWVIFTLPAFLMRIIRLIEFSKKIPMHWGSHPFSLVNDLKDRLMSPINHRYKKNDLYLTIEEIGFKHINIVQKSSGLYIFCKK